MSSLVENGWLDLPIGTIKPLRIASGPLVEQGTINYQRYEIGCRFPPKGIPVESVVKTLSKMFRVKEVVLGNI